MEGDPDDDVDGEEFFLIHELNIRLDELRRASRACVLEHAIYVVFLSELEHRLALMLAMGRQRLLPVAAPVAPGVDVALEAGSNGAAGSATAAMRAHRGGPLRRGRAAAEAGLVPFGANAPLGARLRVSLPGMGEPMLLVSPTYAMPRALEGCAIS